MSETKLAILLVTFDIDSWGEFLSIYPIRITLPDLVVTS
jgi:hypothetical protein